MVKKISGSEPTSSKNIASIDQGTSIAPNKVGGVGQIRGINEQAGAKRVRRPTRPMTAAEREHLFKIIHEEADKLFGPNGLPASQRHTLENAVKITVDASVVDEDEDKEK